MDLFEYAEMIKEENNALDNYNTEIREDGLFIDGKKVKEGDVLFVEDGIHECRFSRLRVCQIIVDYKAQDARLGGIELNEEMTDVCYRRLQNIWKIGALGWSKKSAVANDFKYCQKLGAENVVWLKQWLVENPIEEKEEAWVIDGKEVQVGDELVRIFCIHPFKPEIAFQRIKITEMKEWTFVGDEDFYHGKMEEFKFDKNWQRTEGECVERCVWSMNYSNAQKAFEEWKKQHDAMTEDSPSENN